MSPTNSKLLFLSLFLYPFAGYCTKWEIGFSGTDIEDIPFAQEAAQLEPAAALYGRYYFRDIPKDNSSPTAEIDFLNRVGFS